MLSLNLNAQINVQPEEESFHLQEIFNNAAVCGNVRNYFMNTINSGDLKDFYSNATGAAVGFTSRNYYGFQFGIKGRFVYKSFGSDLGRIDAVAGKDAKWEYELYNILDKGNFRDLNRLEELFIRYRFGKSYIEYGKFETEFTPLLNKSDGRMMPFVHRGGWAHLNFNSKHKVNLGWLNGVSPRATTQWFAVDEALGLFNNGFQPNGEKANYHNFYPSSGVGIINYNLRKENLQLNFYDYYQDKIMNTIWAEVAYKLTDFSFGIQYVYQNPFSYSEDLAYINRYVQPGENGQVLSSQLGWEQAGLKLAFAYTHAFDSGRFLFPKELGRDRFFTSISRSRLEGMGNVDVFVFKTEYRLPGDDFNIGVEMQQVRGAKVGDFEFNKYNVDESFQVNSNLSYQARGFLEGLSFDILWVYRKNQNQTDAKSIFNRSNYNQLNFVTNFSF
jgi:hypothetical protein